MAIKESYFGNVSKHIFIQSCSVKDVKLGMDQAYLNVTPVDQQTVTQDFFEVYGVSDNCYKVSMDMYFNLAYFSVYCAV